MMPRLVFLLLLLITIPSLMYCSDWTDWSEWSPCSNTCGGGISSKSRECLTENCTGPSHLYKSCGLTKACSLSHSFSFRDNLCSTMNKMYMKNGAYLVWTAARNIENSNDCTLICKSGDYMRPLRNDKSMNGAKCLRNGHEKGVCLGQYCAPTGCNRVLGTDVSLSKCLHCPSYTEYMSNLECKQFNLLLRSTSQRGKLAALIPRDSTSITIAFQHVTTAIVLRTSNSLLSLQLKNVTAPFTISGNTFFPLPNYTSAVYTTGPLNQDITIAVESREGESGGTVPRIQYYRLVNETSASPVERNQSIYSWQYGEYSDCSVTCGIGLEVAHVHCRDNEFPNNMLPDSFCSQTNEKKPFPIVRKCLLSPCPPRWKAYGWGQCSAICAGGTQTRTVECVQSDQNGNNEIISSELCQQFEQPVRSRACNTHSCGMWSVSEWSQCSLRCGDGGNQSRSVLCKDGSDGTLIDEVNCHRPKPPSIKPCNNGQCHYVWNIGNWSHCNTGCGNGSQYRSVICQTHLGEKVNSSLCQSSPPPVRNRTCFNASTCIKLWVTSPWSQCEGKCGVSHQIRNVTCRAVIGTTPHIIKDTYCNDTVKPNHKRDCNKTGCVYWRTEEWGQCSHSCGSGTQTRNVTCIVLTTGQPARGCDTSTRPINSKTCNTFDCPNECLDDPSFNCAAMTAQYSHLCDHTYFKDDVCCNTCSKSR